jgi:UDP-GlcNAc:undecaprenyl-phosphate GlcNAc-1-phosphate transferase
MREYGINFGLALAISLLATLIVRTLARRFGLVAKPRADRWHKKPTALYGGVGIFIAFWITFFIRQPRSHEGEVLLVVCSAGMFFVGLIDDFVHLKPYAKLVAQIVISTALTTFGMRLHWLPSPVLDQALTIFWLVGITNAVNLLDNLDGLSGGVAAIAGAFFVYFCHVSGQPAAAAICAGFCGAILGFLVFNVNPASIFMGDCGSLFLGFFLGGITMVGNRGGLRRNIVAVLAIPVLLLLIPIIDTTLVTLSRKLSGRPISVGGRDHTSHRLVALGLSERNAALTLWVLAAASGGIAVLVRSATWPIAALVVPAFVISVVFFLVFIGHVKVYEPVSTQTEVKSRALLPTLADFAYKRRVFEVFNDLVLIILAYYAAFLLRFEGAFVEPHYGQFLVSVPVVIAVQLGAFLSLGLYRGLWRYTSLPDLRTLMGAVAGAWIASVLAIAFLFRLEGYSRAVLVLDGILLMVTIAGSRLSFRVIRDQLLRLKTPTQGSRVVIYGAGDGGEILARELLNNQSLGMVPVAFVDDDPLKKGRVIHGIQVVGSLEQIEILAEQGRVDEVVVSTQRIAPERTETLKSMCLSRNIVNRKMRIAFE